MINNSDKIKILIYLILIVICNFVIDNNLKYVNIENFSAKKFGKKAGKTIKKAGKKVGKAAGKVAGGISDAIMGVIKVVTKPIETIIKEILKIIPKPISKYLKKETKNNKNFFDLIIKLIFAGFKLVLLLGVLPWILVAICSAGSVAGMSMLANGIFSFSKYMFMGSASDVQNSLSNQLEFSDQRISDLENKINQLNI